MNFERMPELKWACGYDFGVGVPALNKFLPVFWRRPGVRKAERCPSCPPQFKGRENLSTGV